MRVLFLVHSPPWLKNFEGVVRMLAERGHRVDVAFHDISHAGGSDALVAGLRDVRGVAFHEAPSFRKDRIVRLSKSIRASSDLVHFLDARFHDAYRARPSRRSPRVVQALTRTPVVRSAVLRRTLEGGLETLYRAIPIHDGIRRYIASLEPDVVLLTPYVSLKTVQPSYLKAARALGVPTGVCVASWDNLTSKSLIRPRPDAVFVWNETQLREAVELHRLPRACVVVTGAQCFDEWMGWKPRPREEFCERIGLDPGRPYVLYVTFTPVRHSAHRDEVGFVRRWIGEIRDAQDETLASAGIVVRPHPKRRADWLAADLGPHRDVVIWPREARFPTDRESKADYFDSIYHSACVVGLNSTAMLEAGIIGRPVLTTLVSEFWESQEGTLHFRYLMEAGGGLLRASREMDEHLRHLADAVNGRDQDAERRSVRFVEAFIRPQGADMAATPVFVDSVERLAERRPELRGQPHLSTEVARGAIRTFLLISRARQRVRRERRRVVWKARLEWGRVAGWVRRHA